MQLSSLWQRCYEHKQYRNGLKFCKQILSNPKFAEHGGKKQTCGWREAELLCFVQDAAHLLLSAGPMSPSRDPGDERLDSELSGEEGGGLRPGEKRPTQRPQEPRLYPCLWRGTRRRASGKLIRSRLSDCACDFLRPWLAAHCPEELSCIIVSTISLCPTPPPPPLADSQARVKSVHFTADKCYLSLSPKVNTLSRQHTAVSVSSPLLISSL